MTEKIESVLTPAQNKRLGELDLQFRGPLALSDDQVAAKMGLSPDQQRQLSNIIAEYRNGQQEVMRSMMGRGGQGGNPGERPDPQAMRARFEEMQKETERLKKASADKVVAMLTAQQKQTWKTLQGKPFTFRTNNGF
jgi:hypothetical protein